MATEARIAALTERLIADVLELIRRELAGPPAGVTVPRARDQATVLARGPLPPPGPARRDFLAARLEEHRGDVSAVARGLARSRGAVHRWIRQYDLAPADFRKFDRPDFVPQLKLHHGNVSRAAKAMQCSRAALHRWIKEAGIAPSDFRKLAGNAERKFDRNHLVTQLKLHRGNVSRAAKAMQCARGTLHRWMKEAGLSARDFRRAPHSVHSRRRPGQAVRSKKS